MLRGKNNTNKNIFSKTHAKKQEDAEKEKGVYL